MMKILLYGIVSIKEKLAGLSISKIHAKETIYHYQLS